MATSSVTGQNLIAGRVLTLERTPPSPQTNGSPPFTASTHAPLPTEGPNAPAVSGAFSGGRGIRNLLVVCYDVDPGIGIQSTASVAPPLGGAAEGIVLERLVGPSFWAKFPGQRLGSTLTDANGSWQLVYQDDLLSDAEPSRRIARPDLLIFVLAPEDTHARLLDHPPGLLEGLWVPDQVTHRVLHFSREVRLNAGRIEHYVIRIREELLAEAGVTDWIAQEGSTARIDLALDALFERNDRVRDKLRARWRDEISVLAGIRDLIKSEGRVRADFLKSPMFRGESAPAYVSAPAAISTPGAVVHAVGGMVAEVVATVTATPEESLRRRFRFRLTDVEAEEAALLRLEGDALQDVVPVDWLMERYRRATSAGTLLANGSPLGRCTLERAVDAALARVMTPLPTVAEPDIVPAALALPYELNTQIDRIMERMAAPAFEPDELVSERLDATSLEQSLGGVNLRPGPADVTAYHHFHRLELALPHVWTELFDDGIRTRGEELYAQVVRTQRELGDAEGYTATIESLENIRQLMEVAQGLAADATTVPDDIRIVLPGITGAAWALLDPQARNEIGNLAAQINSAEQIAEAGEFLTEEERQAQRDHAAELRREVDALVQAEIAEAIGLAGHDPLSRLIFELTERLAAPYQFTVFAPNTVNFGLLVTYRQAWRPISYQVGRLVKTIPLAPGESREYSIKRVEKKSRNEKEIEHNLRIKKRDTESKGTIESQIVSKAGSKTNWKLSAEASGGVGVFSASASAGLDGGAESASEDSKKSMREAVLRASDEDKNEHTWEVSAAEESLVETAETVKISNPNQELPVTYLLYELQRRYGISEKLHAVQPVVLVANEVPPPHEVDEDFLIAHDWIIRRALLDDEFLPALNYLTEGFGGDELRIQILRQAKKTRQDTIDDLRANLEPYDTMLEEAGTKIGDAVRGVQKWTREDESERTAAARIGEEAAREQFQRLVQERADLKAVIDRASADLAEAEKALADALQSHTNMQTAITRLRVHVAQNIIYYMQAIWDTEHPDQRYFRLFNVKVPVIPFPSGGADRILRSERDPLTREWVCETTLPPPGEFVVPPPPPEPPPASWPTLGEVADLDDVLGYKGNYMIFPLKGANDLRTANYLTAFMAQSYVSDSGKGASDPDPAGDATLEELIGYFRCLKEERERAIAAGLADAPERLEDDAAARAVMRRLLAERIANPYKDEQELIVRGDSLFIEALPGSHPVLEDFKLRHRALDVQKVGAELRAQELENLRLAERLRAGEHDDPRVDKRVEIKGATVLSVAEPE